MTDQDWTAGNAKQLIKELIPAGWVANESGERIKKSDVTNSLRWVIHRDAVFRWKIGGNPSEGSKDADDRRTVIIRDLKP